MRLYVHRRNDRNESEKAFYSFEKLPNVGEYIFLGPESPWCRVDLVLNSVAPYCNEIYAHEVDLDEDKAQALADAQVLRGERKERLIFLPETRSWMLEKISDEDTVDFVELTNKGAAMRYPKNELLDALRQAVAELETA